MSNESAKSALTLLHKISDELSIIRPATEEAFLLRYLPVIKKFSDVLEKEHPGRAFDEVHAVKWVREYETADLKRAQDNTNLAVLDASATLNLTVKAHIARMAALDYISQ